MNVRTVWPDFPINLLNLFWFPNNKDNQIHFKPACPGSLKLPERVLSYPGHEEDFETGFRLAVWFGNDVNPPLQFTSLTHAPCVRKPFHTLCNMDISLPQLPSRTRRRILFERFLLLYTSGIPHISEPSGGLFRLLIFQSLFQFSLWVY